MSKRVTNKHASPRKTPARSKVSYGWRKRELFALHGKEAVLSGAYLKDAA